jgi:hypothetical protein
MYRRERERNNIPNIPNIPNDTKIELLTEAEANQSGMDRKMSVGAIPDIEELSSMVVEFIEYYDMQSTKKLRDTNYPVYLNSLYDKFNKMPMSMIKLLSEEDQQVRAENLTKIIDLLETLSKVKKGEVTLDKACDDFTEKQNEAYFYPAFGGKDKLVEDIRSKGGNV